ncbi:MAG: hypothetical protein JWM46_444 [Candidatus Kaiserbacteria bacterium]|nr:hypothetical protein [Candidatus Kaiserbacteria bacterium]
MGSGAFVSKRTALIILGITALACSRAMFSFFNDPEGPNLLVVLGMAVILYFLSSVAFFFGRSTTTFKKVLLAIALQIIIAVGFYLFLK